jgi:hypothetical protein
MGRHATRRATPKVRCTGFHSAILVEAVGIEPYAGTRFFRVSLSKACNPPSYSRTLRYPAILRLALRSGHFCVVTDNFRLGERDANGVRPQGDSGDCA